MTLQHGGLELFRTRIGDAERDECAAQLAEHHARGRLSLVEVQRRQELALHAVTAADLVALLADLPDLTTAAPVRTGSRAVDVPPHRDSTGLVVRTVSRWALPPGAVLVAATLLSDWGNDVNGFFVGLLTGGLGLTASALSRRFLRGPVHDRSQARGRP